MAKILIGKYKATIYPEGNGYTGAISLGFHPNGQRNRPKRKGKTEDEVTDKLIELVDDLQAGIDTAEDYTVGNAVEDWLKRGLKGLDPNTVTTNRNLANKHVIPLIGRVKLKKLRADDVDDWLDGLTDRLATRTLEAVHSILKRAIRHAMARDRVTRNVAEIVKTPEGLPGRPSKALTTEQATAVLDAAKSSPLHAYVVLSLMTGVRTEEARALQWEHVVAWVDDLDEWRSVAEVGFDHERFAVYVWRSVRRHGDTKTKKSRRTLELPQDVAEALRSHHARQLNQKTKADKAWQNNNLVFCTRTGKPLDAGNVRRAFRAICRRAKIGEEWTPRELRHSFVSILSANGISIDTIALLCGHAGTAVTEKVYRKQLKPVITKGAEAMNTIFGNRSTRTTTSAQVA